MLILVKVLGVEYYSVNLPNKSYPTPSEGYNIVLDKKCCIQLQGSPVLHPASQNETGLVIHYSYIDKLLFEQVHTYLSSNDIHKYIH